VSRLETELAGRGGATVVDALQRVTDAALTHLSENELLAELLVRIAEILDADTAAILILDEERSVLRARAARGIEEEVEQGVEIPVGGGFAGRIAAERRPISIDDVDHADILNPILREKGIRSLLGVPLLVEGRVLGVMHVGSLVPRRFTRGEEDLLQLAADRAAIAIEHATLFKQERMARLAAETARERLEALQQITDAGLAYLPEDQLLEELLKRITESMNADTAAILLLDENRVLRAHAARGIEEAVEQGVTIPFGRGFAGRIAAEKGIVAIDDIDSADIVNPLLREKGIKSLLGVPMLVEGDVLGVMHIGTLVPRKFTEEEGDLLQLAADRAAVAIEHANLYEQRRIAESLQRRVLTTDLSSDSITPRLDVASRYLPATGESLGGDWYDAFMLGGGRVAMAVGDVAGHGLEAAAVMAQLRTALRAYATDRETVEAIDRVNRLMIDLGPATMTTLVFVVFDPEAQSIDIFNAGHPPPLLIAPDGTSRFLDVPPGMPLGVESAASYRPHTEPFAGGSTLVLYTDGLVEVRGESLDEGMDRLKHAAHESTSVEELCEAVVNTLIPGDRADDVALVAARARPLPEQLCGTWPAKSTTLAGIRQLLREWLQQKGAGERETYDLVLSSQEACSNAIEHAYGPAAGEFSINAAFDGTRVVIEVLDQGNWRDPRGIDRGRGLPLMEALVDDVQVKAGDGGTVVILTREIRGA
jgi:GAF domain-containing protein/anti-sigma regulatory factor (Ser/Thr protein kinase)